MKNITVIGGSGFIGTRLVSRLINSKNNNCNILDKDISILYPNITTIADVRSLESLISSINPNSLIINLAAEHKDNVKPLKLYEDVNVLGARNVCEAARIKNVKTIIFTSSVAVYGFAPVGTDENGIINPFNEYGRTKYEAELIYHKWQQESENDRTLVIIRPTVVFGEKNRGNVFNLFKQIVSGKFIMVGNGNNRKSLAYVENVVAFIEYSLVFSPGVHIFNYVDKPDLSMNQLVSKIKLLSGKSSNFSFNIPFYLAYLIILIIDFIALITRKKFSISCVRLKKFCANSIYNSSINSTNFIAPVSLDDAIQRTINYEFKSSNNSEN